MKFAALALSTLFVCVGAQAAPQTLVAMLGAKPEPGKLSDSVLIIIDAQREYVDGALPLDGVNSAVNEIGTLLARARKAGTPVIHVVHKGAGPLFNPASPSYQIVGALQPLPNEAIIEKSRTSAFAGTRLGDVLAQAGRKRLILVGFMTHHCVSTTARAARDLGYAATIVGSATATRDLPDNHGGIVKAAVLQAAALAELADATATVVAGAADIAD